jgi:pimeloyl-ACP methyl ester carboxylesterase
VSLLEQLRIPIWGEGRVGLERAALGRDGVLHGEGVPRGDGAPLLLLPGFLAGDLSLSLMARWLSRIGYQPRRAGIVANIDCTDRALRRLEGQLEGVAERHGRSVTLVGHSRGGTMARVLAVRRPDLVECVVSLGSPITDELALHPLVRAQVETVALLGSLGVPGLFSHGCSGGRCCQLAREQAGGPFPRRVGFTSVYSRSDGVVDWHACLDPAARHVEVSSSHVGMAVNREVYRALADTLAHHRSAAGAARLSALEPRAARRRPARAQPGGALRRRAEPRRAARA